MQREETRNGTGTTLAATEFQYDCPYTSGNVTEERRWDSQKASSVPGRGGIDGASAVILNRAYDIYGNLIAIDGTAVATHLTYAGIPGSSGPGPYPTTIEFAPGTAAARRWNYAWNADTGTLTAKTDAQNNVTTFFTYDLYGRRLTATEAGLRRTETIYDDESRKVTVKQDLDLLGDGKLQSVTHYDQLGRVTLFRTSDGYALGTGSTDGIKVSTAYTMTLAGLRVVSSSPYRSTSDATLEWTCVQHDRLGRVSEVGQYRGIAPPADCISPVNQTGLTHTVYNADQTIVIDPAGVRRDEHRDGLGRVVQVVEDPLNLNYATNYQYDALGNLTTVMQSDGSVTQTRSFHYSSLGRLLSAANPESGTTSYAYFDTGDLASRTDARGITTTYSYDELHRLLTKTYTGDGGVTPNVTYSYYKASAPAPNIGRLESVVSSTASNSYSNYDALGRAQNNTQTVSGNEYPFQYTYRLNDSLSAMQYPSGKTVNYAADDAGRVNRVSTSGTTYADLTFSSVPFTPDGRIAQLKLGNGLWETRDYQTPGTPTLLKLGTSAGANDELELEYDYSATANNGNLDRHVIRQAGQTWTQTFSYDGVNRLASASEAGGFSRSYGYDRFGNRWVAASSGITAADSHEPTVGTLFDRTTNRLAIQSYDAAGNLTSYDPRTLSYDAENRMIAATSQFNGNESLVYDGDGRRVRKNWTPGGGARQITFYVYGPNGHVAAEYTNQTPPATGTSWMFTDLLGSVRAVTGEKPQSGSASIIECYDYLPFGRMLSQSDNGRNTGCYPNSPDFTLSTVESAKFTGKERDVELGLDYFGARYMSAAQGRFTSADPVMIMKQRLRDPQQWNMYAYVRNNPLRLVDPNGKWPAEIHSAIIAGAFTQLTEAQRIVLRNASERVDGVLNGGQLSANSYKHGMRSPSESASEARAKADNFIATQEAIASQIARQSGGITDAALDQFGEALHTVTDRTSPAHQGEQEWRGIGEPGGVFGGSSLKVAIDTAAAKIHTSKESTITLDEYHKAIDAAREEYMKTFGPANFYQATGCLQVAGCGYKDDRLQTQFRKSK